MLSEFSLDQAAWSMSRSENRVTTSLELATMSLGTKDGLLVWELYMHPTVISDL